MEVLLTWAFLDDRADENPKLLGVGAEAAWYYACGLCYCRRNESVPGFIPDGKARVLYPVGNVRRVIDLLVSAKLWHQVDGGYEVHDYGQVYGKSNAPSGPELAAKRSEAGRLGGLAKASKRASKTPGKNGSKTPGKEPGNGPSKPLATLAHARPVREDPDPDPDLSEKTTAEDLTGSPAREAGSGGSKKIRCPLDLDLTSDQRATLESSMIPGWAIDVLRTELVTGWVSDPSDKRPEIAWLKCLGKAIAGEWNKRGSRLVRPGSATETARDSVNSAEGFV